VKHCPGCGSGNVRRSTIRRTDTSVHPLRSPYRCRACGHRFWVISRKARAGLAATAAGVLTLTTIAVGSILLSRYETDSETAATASAFESGPDMMPRGPMLEEVVTQTLHSPPDGPPAQPSPALVNAGGR